jgi:two-component system response regulator AlgR
MIPVTDILYFRAEQKYVCVRHVHGQDLIDESLRSLEQALAGDFVRIHRNALVRVDAIERLQTQPGGQLCIVLRKHAENGDNERTDNLVVSRRHRASVRRRVKGR